MANFKVLAKDKLKELVDAQLETVAPNDELIISSARMVKGGKMELEFVQARELRSSTISAVSILNAADVRFSQNGKKVFRVWMSVEVESAKESLRLDFGEVAKLAETIQPDERIVIMQPVTTMYQGTNAYKINIQVMEEVDATRIKNKSIRESIINQDQYAENYELRIPDGKGGFENIVDENGNAVFRWTEIVTVPEGETILIEDQLVANKKSVTRFNEDLVAPKSFVKSVVTKPADSNVKTIDSNSAIPLAI